MDKSEKNESAFPATEENNLSPGLRKKEWLLGQCLIALGPFIAQEANEDVKNSDNDDYDLDYDAWAHRAYNLCAAVFRAKKERNDDIWNDGMF